MHSLGGSAPRPSRDANGAEREYRASRSGPGYFVRISLPARVMRN